MKKSITNFVFIALILGGILLLGLKLNIGSFINVIFRQEKDIKTQFFIAHRAVNVRKCPLETCSVIGQKHEGDSIKLPYKNVDEMSEWIDISLEYGNATNTHYINKIAFSIHPEASEIFKHWNPRVVKIVCKYQNAWRGGSGLLTKISGIEDEYVVVTARHVVTQNNILADTCEGHILNEDSVPLVDKQVISNYDLAILKIENPSIDVKNIASESIFACKNLLQAESILLIGYPISGAEKGTTITEGIISGYQDDFYLADLKADHGHSGGPVIGIKENCFAGILIGERGVPIPNTKSWTFILKADRFIGINY